MMIELKLLPGPELWFQCYPMKKAANVTANAHEFLQELVQVDPKITLSDVFGLFAADPLLSGNFSLSFISELLKEVEKGPSKIERSPKRESLEYLDIYAEWRLDSFENIYSGVGHLNMCGSGPVLTRNVPMYAKNKGERIEFGLSFSPVRNLLLLPVKIRSEVNVFEDDIDSHLFREKIGTHIVKNHTLGSIIKAIVSTLTFHGGPEEMAETANKIKAMSKSIDRKKIKGTNADDFFGKMDQDGIKLMFKSIGEHQTSDVTWALRKIPNTEIASQALELELPGVIVKQKFKQTAARDFRKTFREAKRFSMLKRYAKK